MFHIFSSDRGPLVHSGFFFYLTVGYFSVLGDAKTHDFFSASLSRTSECVPKTLFRTVGIACPYVILQDFASNVVTQYI